VHHPRLLRVQFYAQLLQYPTRCYDRRSRLCRGLTGDYPSSRPGELHPQALTDSGLERLRSSGSYRPVNAGCNNGQ
jgi:hypothetical protein